MSQVWSVTLAGVELPCVFRFPDTRRYFSALPSRKEAALPDPVCIREGEWRDAVKAMPANAHTEYSVLTASFGDALLDFDRMILHGVALRRGDRAWLICGNSGVGKSTQARKLQELRPGEFSVICGDRPILQFCHSERSEESVPIPRPSERSEESVPAPRPSERGEESVPALRHSERSEESVPAPRPSERGEESVPALRHSERSEESVPILVHPSPWNGKENWHGAPAAPLAGVIILKRGEENTVTPLPPAAASLAMFQFVIQTYWEKERILAAARRTEELLQSVPVWRMTSHELPDSTSLLLETVFSG